MADAVEQPASARRSAHKRRFLLANLVVVGGFAAVLVFFAFLVARTSGRPWSNYTPTGKDVFQRAQHMADHVAPRYVYGGQSVAAVQAQPLLYQDAVVDGIAFTRSPFRKIGSPYTQFEPAGSTIAFVFCGQGQCSLPDTGSQEVVPLLRRESLELALYTFKYSPTVDSVVTLLPPSGRISGAIYLTRKNLAGELTKPLDDTLPPHQQVSYGSMTDVERSTVERLTADHLFESRFAQGPNGRTLLVLRPVSG